MEKDTFTLREGDEYIDLISLLKLKQIAQSGGDAKMLVSEGMVIVNDELESRKRRKLRRGDVVVLDGIRIEIL